MSGSTLRSVTLDDIQSPRRGPVLDQLDMLGSTETQPMSQKGQIELFKLRFGYAPGKGKVVKALKQRRVLRQAYDQTRLREELTSEQYLDDREKSLRDTVGPHYLIDQLGVRAVSAKGVTGLKTQSNFSSPYARTAPHQQSQQILDMAAKKCGIKITPELYFNSEDAVGQLKQAGGLPDNVTITVKKIAPGIWGAYLAGDGIKTSSDLDDAITSITIKSRYLGLTPSPHQGLKYINDEAALKPKLSEESLGNANAVDGLTPDGNPSLKALAGLNSQHPSAAIAKSVASMAGGLKDAIGKLGVEEKKIFDRDLLVQDALMHLQALIESMAVSLDDSTQTGKLYELMIDDLYTVLASAKPYKIEDASNAAKALIKQRSPALDKLTKESGVQAEPFLLSSGMQALTVGIGAACDALKQPPTAVKQIGPNYFEVGIAIGKGDEEEQKKSRVLRAILHPSSPSVGQGGDKSDTWTVQKLIEEVTRGLEGKQTPVVLMLDVTIEQKPDGKDDGSSDLDEVIDAFKIPVADGSLKMVICKSYQKYLSLGTAKIMAGGATVIGTDDECLQALKSALQSAQDGLEPMESDEMQMMTHIMGTSGPMELAMMQQASSNAKLAQTLCGFEGAGTSEDGLPFLMTKIPQGLPGEDKGLRSKPILDLCRACGMEERQSFGFPATSCMRMDDPEGHTFARIAMGQDHPGAMVEKTYAIGKFVNDPSNDAVTPERIGKLIETDTGKAVAVLVEKLDKAALRGALLAVLSRRSPRPDELLQQIETAETLSADPVKDYGLAPAEQIALVGASFQPAPLIGTIDEKIGILATGGALTGTAMQWRGDEQGAKGEPPPEVEHLGSMIASSLRLAAVLAKDGESAEQAALRQKQYEAFIDGGMPGASVEGRRQVFLDWAEVSADLVTLALEAAAQQDALQEDIEIAEKRTAKFAADLERNASQVVEESARLKLFRTLTPAAFVRLGAKQQVSLIETVFGKLSVGSQIELIKQLPSNPPDLRSACLLHTGARVDAALTGNTPIVLATTLPVMGGAQSGEQTMRKSEIEEVAKLYRDDAVAELVNILDQKFGRLDEKILDIKYYQEGENDLKAIEILNVSFDEVCQEVLTYFTSPLRGEMLGYAEIGKYVAGAIGAWYVNGAKDLKEKFFFQAATSLSKDISKYLEKFCTSDVSSAFRRFIEKLESAANCF